MEIDGAIPASIFLGPSRSMKRARTFKTTRGPATKRRKIKGSSIRTVALRTGGWVNAARSPEMKFTDVNNTIQLPAGGGGFAAGGGILLNGLATGSGADQRIGRKVVWKTFLLRWQIELEPGGASTNGTPVRILVVYDKQANTVAPAATDILALDNFRSAQNLSNRDRFLVLVDKITPPIGTSSNFCVAGKIYRKRLNLETIFNANSAGTVGDITSGSIYIFAAQTSNVGTTGPQLHFNSRLRYTDF